MKLLLQAAALIILFSFDNKKESWIRINLLGYKPQSTKVAVWCGKSDDVITSFSLVDSATGKNVFQGPAGKNFGAYGPFKNTYRLDFSSFNTKGIYFIKAGTAISPVFRINDDVYNGAADFCLQYMRQQRSGFNPFLKDSCHTHDGYVLYGQQAGIADSTHIDVVGGWHDASDYLQYSSTSANATYHLLIAYRDFKNVFADNKLSNGLDGKNGMADVLDEAKWGLDWLLKMHPRADWMFNQVADDRDHMGMRIPKEDTFYGRGYERPVYFIDGMPQQRGKFLNNTTGTSSTAAKIASAFALGFEILGNKGDYYNVIAKNAKRNFSDSLFDKTISAYAFAERKLGVTQTASVRSPYIYAEDNWTDDMELAGAAIYNMQKGWVSGSGEYLLKSLQYSKQEKITPWLGEDTAKHYQWYPFINLGHYELAKQLEQTITHYPKKVNKKITGYLPPTRDTIINYYKTGIERVGKKAMNNAFFRGIPFIWCSNNLTTSFAIQCYWYRELSGDKTFEQLEQANFDWLFGCNPWGTSMVYGLPSWGDTPSDPHSAFTHLKNYPINGGLVDGPVYTSIYRSLIGIKLYEPDEYETFQSDLAVYHDDYGDYSTNEPTMDGTASLIYLLAAKENEGRSASSYQYDHGAIISGDRTKKQIALVFTADEFGEGGKIISDELQKQNIKASFFFTGRFYRNPSFAKIITQLKQRGHYLGPHSDQHLLYADWTKRDSLLVTRDQFVNDLERNIKAIEKFGVQRSAIKYFIPPYEWHNDSIAMWSKQMGLQLINYTPGTKSTSDYTWPELNNYRSSEEIYRSIIEKADNGGLNGNILLLHFGTDPRRTDKFYNSLGKLFTLLMKKGYNFKRIDQMLRN